MKNYGIWLRYNSRSGTHNMYKEFRALTLCEAVNKLCACARSAQRRPRRRARADRRPRRRSRVAAAATAVQDMNGRHRTRERSIQIIKTAELKASECKRPNVTQFHVRGPRVWVAAAISSLATRARSPSPSHGLLIRPPRSVALPRRVPLLLQDSKIAFPLPHRVPRASHKKYRTTFKAQRPTTIVE